MTDRLPNVMNLFRLEGRTALVTGGSRGLGRVMAEALAEAGASVCVTSRDAAAAAHAAAEIAASTGARAVGLDAELTTGEGVARLVDAVASRVGQVDILVNNAGINIRGMSDALSEEDWDAVIDTNLKSTFLMTKAVLRGMVRQRSGRIVNISSVSGLLGNAGQSNYAASKAGMIGFTRSIAREVASRGITVNAVAPGFIDTAMTQGLSSDVREALQKQIPLGRLGLPSDIAAAVRFLVSDAASYITGQVLHVNGGMLMV